MNMLNIVVLYLILINITGFTVMGIDKRKAVKHRWRVRESTLFLFALIGGSAGSILGMRVFHHKTRHWYFVYGMPLILILQILLAMLILKRG
ncbi:MAG: DUF1294 domain-containing protein [Lachnospiraceae bacterium]|nr:DUF1294 domain-containing protein [Lachnospiraceae bacterium]